MRDNMNNFRVFGRDETASNRLQAIYEATRKTWLAGYRPEDADGSELAPDGRVMEMLSEQTLGRVGRRLRSDRPPCVPRLLRSVLPHHRFDGQPAREVAGEVQDRSEMAGVDSVLESGPASRASSVLRSAGRPGWKR